MTVVKTYGSKVSNITIEVKLDTIKETTNSSDESASRGPGISY